MKKLFLFSLILLNTAVFAQSQKIGYVDSEVILKQYAPAIKAQSDLDAMISKWNAQIDSMRTDLQVSYQQYQQQEATMAPANIKQAQQALVMKEQQMGAFNQQKFGQPNGEIFINREELFKPIKEKILVAIDEVRKTEKMSFVFDKTGDVILLFADSQFDLTFKVLDKLKTIK